MRQILRIRAVLRWIFLCRLFQITSSKLSSSTSGSAQIVNLVDPSTTPTGPSTSQTTELSVPSQTAQWTVNDRQVCRAVRRKSIVPSNGTRSGSSGDRKTSKPGWKFIGVIVAFVLTMHIH